MLGRHRTAGDGGDAEVLVVDDDAPTRELLRRTLVRAGWRVREAGGGREALAALERSTPALILLDLMMPEMDGFQLLEALRRGGERWREIPVVIVTAKDLSREEMGWLMRNAERVFQKGAYDRTELIGVVHAMISRRLAAA